MPQTEVMAPRLSAPAGTRVPAWDPDQTRRLSAAGLHAFARIAKAWGLSTGEQRLLLGGVPESTFFKYIKRPERARLSSDTLERISHVVAIFKSLNVLLPRAEAADAWIRRPNSAALFKGRSALDFIGGRFADLVAVRNYLDAARGS